MLVVELIRNRSLQCADVINQSLDDLFPSPEVQVIAEPGRYFVCSAFTLATNIHSKREIRSSDGNITNVMYYINDGVYGSFNAKLYEDADFHGVPLDVSHTVIHFFCNFFLA